MRFEWLSDRHIPQVLEIERQSNPCPWSEHSFRAELGNPQSLFLVALLGEEVVGYAGLWQVVDEAHVTTVAVAPAHRRSGIGKGLMSELLERAKRAGMSCSTLEVRASNHAAIKMYEGLGYRATARRRRYYPDNREDAVVMWLYDLSASLCKAAPSAEGQRGSPMPGLHSRPSRARCAP